MTKRKSGRLCTVVLLFAILISGCATLREVAAIRNVNFDLDRVTEMRLAGVSLSKIRSYQDLGLTEMTQLGMALAEQNVPLEFNLHLRAENPPDNKVQARLVRMDWTLLLQDRDTISGVLDQEIILPPGQPQDVPLAIHLDLLEFFDGGVRDLVEFALALAGEGGAPKNIALRATPTIDTAIGPIRYPQPITIRIANP